ncbi:MAG TPA: VapC toxin family PIN domain ribonuclease, partial [Verrucomicrobia bacterium]|nr:VapC toxin family PIN domain ribonuclease [Verrucomicrobiota bacterium]
MRFCLDTDTCINAMKGRYPGMVTLFGQFEPADFGIPAIVYAELLLGILKSQSPAKTRDIVEAFLAPFELIPFDRATAREYAIVRHDLEVLGKPIGPNDLMIAATARARNLTLITHNIREFKRVTGLMIEDW